MSIQAQGTRHSSRASMIAQLEAALERLKNGDTTGEHSDDDFGYRFIVNKAMDCTIFKDPASYL
ncbi:hypothetical protein D9M71_821870 [compost metagenome]